MMRKKLRCMAAVLLATNLAATASSRIMAGQVEGQGSARLPEEYSTKTPIKHVVIIFEENVSFDHYFATYPRAENPEGEPPFHARPGTPSVNGLTEPLHTNNPNGPEHLPFRLDRSQNYTCSMNHGYMAEQQAFDSGLMDMFPKFTARACSSTMYPDVSSLGVRIVMGYFDGNTVTALWNYAQHFALNDSFYGTTFGPSTLGALNLISGMTGGADPTANVNTGDLVVNNAVIGDPDPFYDDCSGDSRVGMLKTNKNIGDLLNAKGITWGWFQGGFTPSTPYVPATSNSAAKPAVCATKAARMDGTRVPAYIPHREPFEYYASTANAHHLPPRSVAMIGQTDLANHQYDLSDFWRAASSARMPAVSFLKANAAQDGHPGYSSPLDEQVFITTALNKLQSLPEWNETAVFIAYDDSDGWYDHVIGPIVNQSASSADALTSPGKCGTGANSLAGLQSRCGYGPRLPLLVISPFAKENFVDSTVTDQASILRFIEDNWNLGRIGTGSFDQIAGPVGNMFDFRHRRNDRIILDSSSGEVVSHANQ
jgi:phospholipase C